MNIRLCCSLMLSIEQKSRGEPVHGRYAPSSLMENLFLINKQHVLSSCCIQTIALWNRAEQK